MLWYRPKVLNAKLCDATAVACLSSLNGLLVNDLPIKEISLKALYWDKTWLNRLTYSNTSGKDRVKFMDLLCIMKTS